MKKVLAILLALIMSMSVLTVFGSAYVDETTLPVVPELTDETYFPAGQDKVYVAAETSHIVLTGETQTFEVPIYLVSKFNTTSCNPSDYFQLGFTFKISAASEYFTIKGVRFADEIKANAKFQALQCQFGVPEDKTELQAIADSYECDLNEVTEMYYSDPNAGKIAFAAGINALNAKTEIAVITVEVDASMPSEENSKLEKSIDGIISMEAMDVSTAYCGWWWFASDDPCYGGGIFSKSYSADEDVLVPYVGSELAPNAEITPYGSNANLFFVFGHIVEQEPPMSWGDRLINWLVDSVNSILAKINEINNLISNALSKFAKK